MISTVTTSTVTTITAIGSNAGLAGALALVVVLSFLLLLIVREVLGGSSINGSRTLTLTRGLNIALVPLGLAFFMIAGARLASLLL